MTSREYAEREAFLLEAIHLMSQRFLLREIWERMDIDPARGIQFACTDPMMVGFRQLLFRKVVQVLRQVDLLTVPIRDLMLAEGLATPQTFAAAAQAG